MSAVRIEGVSPVVRHLALRYPGRSMRAVVQSWNQRSLRLTQRLVFRDEGELTAVQGGRSVSYRIVVRPADPSGRAPTDLQ